MLLLIRTFTQMPQPMHNSSESDAFLDPGTTSIQSFPIRTTGQDFLHSWRQRFGLHLSSLTMAMRISLSVSSFSLRLYIVLQLCKMDRNCK